ncbi:acetate/propionate family kinase [Methylobacterium mesophilicum SR1.6/6]|uniref:Acetate kinase n=1 Tax=Methylobacterium mesophilicum SR1.6/6 TaxID=908290 RepID=A0A6B9FM79_9HYPH|nr:acetate/propionate family kinase [Methylobacterium mesophilicum]QGY03019.1 acetate/propionate family kinase [Methylobacterium mesophilicum SR1.6/6]
MTPVLLVLNAGSSSLKFQVFASDDAAGPCRLFRGLFEGLGGSAHLIIRDGTGSVVAEARFDRGGAFGHEEALLHVSAWLGEQSGGFRLIAAGHRIVHGGTTYSEPVRVDTQVLEALERLVPLAPLHQPHNLEPIRILQRRLPDLPQIACFDTAFHAGQPEIARLFAVPHAMIERGVRRYGFHGLSYAYIASVLAEYDPALAAGRVIVAHLGSGASLCALNRGASVATTMGFSALDGLPMGTRCGSLDAGVVFYMLREMKLGPDEAERMLYTQSGLLGVSGISNDMRTLRSVAVTDPDARRAIDLFVYRIGRELGSLVAALGGIDALIFTAGIGENDAATRAEVLRGAAWAGFTLDEAANASGSPRVTRGSGPSAWVIPTDEELMIARGTRAVLAQHESSRPRPTLRATGDRHGSVENEAADRSRTRRRNLHVGR